MYKEINVFKTIIFMSFFSIIFGCNKSNTSESKLPEITNIQEQEEGFSDIALKIIDIKNLGNNFIYIAKGKYNNKIVGLKLSLKNNIKAGINNNGEIQDTAFSREGLKLESIGKESDNFIQALSEIYNIKSTNKFSSKIVNTTLFPLNQFETNLNKPNYYKFKVFFNDNGDENEYAEIFININLEQNLIEYNEKDNEYRSNIIKVLSEN